MNNFENLQFKTEFLKQYAYIENDIEKMADSDEGVKLQTSLAGDTVVIIFSSYYGDERKVAIPKAIFNAMELSYLLHHYFKLRIYFTMDADGKLVPLLKKKEIK